ncbi:MAG: serine/threonine protein kinase [Candidatus Nitrosocaldaceae archaeon]|nr:MAG: serine/threonine protein kinase [Candidatus Nitrosocaldaceae archaeon]
MEEDISEKISKKLAKDIYRYEREQRYKIHDKDEKETIEEVFDKHTLLTLYKIINRGIIDQLYGVIDAGKESRVYLGIKGDQKLAVKIFLVSTAEFKKRLQYILGDPRFKSIKKGMRNLVNIWVRKEYVNLKTAYEHNVPVPKPIYHKDNILIMEFIGNDNRAPTLNECRDITNEHYEQVIDAIRLLYKAGLVHADLSEFNIFMHNDKIILFDFGSAVELAHPNSEYFLTRDINNINRFFSKHGINVYNIDDILKRVKSV